MLYMLVLELSEDWQAGLALLDGPLGAKLAKSASYSNFCRSKRLELTSAAEDWAGVARLAGAELASQPDQWAAATQLIGAVRRLQEAGQGREEVKEVETVAGVETLLARLQRENPELRGPWLAGLELLQELRPASCPALLTPALTSYFTQFSSKPVTYSDLERYLSCEADWARDWVREMAAQFTQPPASLAELCRDINLVQLGRLVGEQAGLGVEQLQQEVERLVERYVSAQPLVQHMLPTDLRPSDTYLVLAAHLLWRLWRDTGRDTHFLHCGALLYRGLAACPSNWQLKLLLVRLMREAGAGAAAFTVHASLDIKVVFNHSDGREGSQHFYQYPIY